MKKLMLLSLVMASQFMARGQSIVQIPLHLSGTGVFTWPNAIWWTNSPAPTNIETWQAWWAVNTNFALLQAEIEAAGGLFLTTNQVISVSGDATGSGRTTIALTVTNLQPPTSGSPGNVLTKTSTGVAFSNDMSVAIATNYWALSGNALGQTNSFIGTTDGNPLKFKVNSLLVMELLTNGSIAIGPSNNTAVGCIAIGTNSSATGTNSIAIGNPLSGQGTRASGLNSVSIGPSSVASAEQAFALGVGNNSSGYSSFTLGVGALASGNYSIAIGPAANCVGDYGLALGSSGRAGYAGSLVWADTFGTPNGDSSSNQMVLNCRGGAAFYTGGNGIICYDKVGKATVRSAMTNGALYASAGLQVDASAVVKGNVTATNFITSGVKWIDVPMNYQYGVAGVNAPTSVAVTNGSPIEALAFKNTSILFAQGQLPHTIAITNSSFPRFYIEPHVHFDTVGTLDSTHSNVTWQLEWSVASLNGTWVQGTNYCTNGISANYTHYIGEFGHITNDPPLGISAVFRCRLTRPALKAQDYSNLYDVLLGGLDIHVPVGNTNAIGSGLDNSP